MEVTVRLIGQAEILSSGGMGCPVGSSETFVMGEGSMNLELPKHTI
jgi:hypothetical protein